LSDEQGKRRREGEAVHGVLFPKINCGDCAGGNSSQDTIGSMQDAAQTLAWVSIPHCNFHPINRPVRTPIMRGVRSEAISPSAYPTSASLWSQAEFLDCASWRQSQRAQTLEFLCTSAGVYASSGWPSGALWPARPEYRPERMVHFTVTVGKFRRWIGIHPFLISLEDATVHRSLPKKCWCSASVVQQVHQRPANTMQQRKRCVSHIKRVTVAMTS
jgi:hypothetical protein